MKSIELFAGAGGMALGIEQAGFENVLCIEIDKACIATLKANRPNWNSIQADITEFDFKPYKGIDLVAGGFPCQPFSYSGKELGFEDTRGTLFYEFARAVKQTNPKYFIAENVKGLLTHDKGRTFEVIKTVFESLGYDIYHKVLDASEYGIGQRRQRLFMVGIRKDLNKLYEFPKPYEQITTLKQALENCPESEGAKYNDQKRELFEKVSEGGNWRDLPLEEARKYCSQVGKSGGTVGVLRRLAWDEPSLTILTTPSQKLTERCHPVETRPLTIRESARVQGFPDEWVFKGSMANQYKQIGNAVPPNLAKVVAEQLLD